MMNSIRLLAALAAFIALPGASLASQAGAHDLSNSQVRLLVDKSGNLVELSNRATGNSYVRNAGNPLWKMYYRTADALELEVSAGAAPTIRRDGAQLIISYPSLKGNTQLDGKFRNLKVALELRAQLSGDQLIWTATIVNSESEKGLEVTELWLPWIYGISDLGMGRSADVLYWPEDGGRRIENPHAQLTSPAPPAARTRGARAYQMTYPWPASMQWFTLNNGLEGIYIGSHDKTLMTTTLNVMAHGEAGLSACMVKYPFVRPGESWTSEPVVIRLYSGDWHVAARGYRTWADSWIPKVKPPTWVQNLNGWIIPNLKAQNGSRYRGVYGDLPKYYRDAHAVGIDMVSIYGWEKQGFDNLYPEYDADPGMGGEAGLKSAIAEINKAGGHTLVYTQGQLIDPATEFYRKGGQRMTAKDIWGYEYREMYGGGGQGTLLNVQRNKYFGVACPLAKGWYEQLVKQFEMVKGYGAKSLIYDQLGGRPPYICYDPNHDHSKPSMAAGPGKIRNFRLLHELIKSHDPDFGFVNELVVDCYLGYVDITQPVGYGFVPGPESFGAMYKYTFPEHIVTNRTGGTDPKTAFAFAFSLGWRFDAMMRDTNDATVGPFLKRMSDIRTEFADLLLTGRFVDNEGFLADNSNVHAYAFTGGDRLAVTLWNPTAKPQKVNLVAPGYRLEAMRWTNPAWTGEVRSLLPNDIAVAVFRRN
jgi:hypothetical protein